jgi:hypothetical protein
MDDDYKFTCIMFGTFALIVGVTAVLIEYDKGNTARTAMENGYIQQVDQRTNKTIWVKDSKP